jgi:hypothetical protein
MNRFVKSTLVLPKLLKGNSQLGGTRLLNVHEYVSMDIMRSFGIPVPNGGVATTVQEASQVYKNVIGEGINSNQIQ